MVAKARRERERREVRQGILDAAREIARQDGWQAVTIRRLADRVEYSPPIIYQHFASKDAVLLELVREGFDCLRVAMESARDSSLDPLTDLQRMAAAYWNFAWDAPDLYQVMFGLGGVPFGVAETWMEGSLIGEAALPVVSAIHRPGEHPDQKVAEARVLALWATLHGLVALTMAGRIAGGRAGAYPLVEQSVADVLTAWSSPSHA